MSGDEGELDDWLCSRCEANAITEVRSEFKYIIASGGCRIICRQKQRVVMKLHNLKETLKNLG